MYRLYFDGGIRNRQVTYGYVLCDKDDKVIQQDGGIMPGVTLTSNVAEYTGLIVGLGVSCSYTNRLKVIGDSQLIIKQMNEEYKVKSANLKHLHYMAKIISQQFMEIEFIWVPREHNKEADAMTRDSKHV